MEIRLTGNLPAGGASPAGEPVAKDPGWQPGQVLQGKVTGKVGDDAYLVKVEGREVVARSPFPLERGQSIIIEVQGQKDGAYQVKLLKTGPVLAGADLKGVLNRLGLSDTLVNRTLVQEFMARSQPLQPQLLGQAARMVEGLPGEVPQRVQTVMLAMEAGIPLKGPVMEALHAFLTAYRNPGGGQETPAVQRFLGQLASLLEGTAGEGVFPSPAPGEGGPTPGTGGAPPRAATADQPLPTPSPGGFHEPPPLSEGAKALFRQVREMVRAMTLRPEGGAAKLAEQLKQLLAAQLPGGRGGQGLPTTVILVEKEGNPPAPPGIQPAVPPTGEVDRPLPGQPPESRSLESPEAKIAALFDGPKGRATAESIGVGTRPQTLSEGADGLPAQGKSAETSLARHGDLAAKPRVFSGIVEKLSLLIQEVQKAVEQSEHNQAGLRLVREGTAVERQLVGQQILQAAERGEQKQDFLYFHLPLWRNGQEETWGQLRIAKDGQGQKAINPEGFSLALLLNTENLGPLLLEIKVWGKEVSASGKVADDGVAQAFRQAWPALQDRFAALGLRLQQGSWQVGPVERTLLSAEEGPAPKAALPLLDVKV